MPIAFWRDLSIVLLALEAFILSLLALAVAYALGRGVTYLLREVPGYFAQIRDILAQVQDVVTRITDRIVSPVLSVARFVARLRGIAAGIGRAVGLR